MILIYLFKCLVGKKKMKLAYWMYAGPAHIGTLRIASSFKNVHAIMHAPLGDDYFNVMRSMLERKREFTPVTASVVDRHVLARGSQEKVINNIRRKDLEEHPDLVILTPTCTSSILQEDLQNFVNRAGVETQAEVLLADVNHYRVNEMQAADRTLEQIVEFYLTKEKKNKSIKQTKTETPSVNIIGAYNLAFHNQHDIAELKRLFSDLGIKVNEIIPEGASVHQIKNLPKAWFNFIPYREVGLLTAEYLEKEYQMPYIDITPIGIIETARFIRKIQLVLESLGKQVNFEEYINVQTRFISQSAWFSRSIDCQNLTGKKAFVFGDSTHAAAITKILTKEMGINVLVAGTYCKNDKAWFTKEVGPLCDEVIITDDHKVIGDLIAKLEPNAIFGTQMERHVAKRLNIPCGVISAPVHIQNFPLSYRPFCGYEGANQIADLIYNSFTLGMEDHLLEIFGGHDTKELLNNSESTDIHLTWSLEAEQELSKIPGFVRGKIKRKTENFASSKNLSTITLDVMYAAKEAIV
jgi:light-independent protochlorophyllide reductase subunit B